MKTSLIVLPLVCGASFLACSSDPIQGTKSRNNTGGADSGSGGENGSGGGVSESGGSGSEGPSGGGPGASGGADGSGGALSGAGGTATAGGTSGDGDGDGDAPGAGGATNPISSACDLPTLDSALGAATSQLTVVDWAGKEAALSYTFDDAHSSQVENYDALNALGVRFTFYLTTNWVGDVAPWVQAYADGHEIGNHTKSHAGTASDAEIDDATAFIQQNIGVTPLTMAAPNGSTTYSTPAMSRFLFNRGVGGGSISPGDDVNRYNLPTYIPPADANQGTLDSGVSSAVSQGRWQTVLVHGFSAGAYQAISLDGFLAHVEGQRDSGNVWIDTLMAVGSYFVGQKLLEDTAPEQSGSESTWSWTLPDHFPEGRCLRIQSTGSVFQDGTEVPQNPLGYYDISLDAGQVTIEQ